MISNATGPVMLPINVVINLKTAELGLGIFMETGKIYEFCGVKYECLGWL